uniref:Uncharacterized protein n=1 Tax=Glossina palpalis gambiensis TaxID=67801 RepID=A0A1B0B885_9MUSC
NKTIKSSNEFGGNDPLEDWAAKTFCHTTADDVNQKAIDSIDDYHKRFNNTCVFATALAILSRDRFCVILVALKCNLKNA